MFTSAVRTANLHVLYDIDIKQSHKFWLTTTKCWTLLCLSASLDCKSSTAILVVRSVILIHPLCSLWNWKQPPNATTEQHIWLPYKWFTVTRDSRTVETKGCGSLFTVVWEYQLAGSEIDGTAFWYVHLSGILLGCPIKVDNSHCWSGSLISVSQTKHQTECFYPLPFSDLEDKHIETISRLKKVSFELHFPCLLSLFIWLS